jgi:protein ImuB
MGGDRIGTPVLEETHRPDAFRMQPFRWDIVESAVPSEQSFDALSTAHATAALRRFRPVMSASLLQDKDTPAHVRSAEISGKIIAQRGPYFLSGNWWDEKSWARAEWDLQLQNGELVRAHERDGVWKIDGVYD